MICKGFVPGYCTTKGTAVRRAMHCSIPTPAIILVTSIYSVFQFVDYYMNTQNRTADVEGECTMLAQTITAVGTKTYPTDCQETAMEYESLTSGCDLILTMERQREDAIGRYLIYVDGT